jgi:hypothetical protein
VCSSDLRAKGRERIAERFNGMMVMPANWSKGLIHHWATKWPGRLGHLYGPGSQRGPYRWLPYAGDNNRFPCWQKKIEWNESAYRNFLEWCYRAALGGQPPLWLLVPDVVADRDGTLREWDKWSSVIENYGFPLAFAVQDGMSVTDVPDAASVIFVGGSTEWKWRTARLWCESFPRVHIGRVNGYKDLLKSQCYGAESVDGTGWTRGDSRQLAGLERWLEEEAGERVRPVQVNLYEGINL